MERKLGNKMDELTALTRSQYQECSLGRSDHNLVLLTPCYVPLVKRLPVTTKTVRTWSEDCYEALQGCFEVTDWNVLCEPHGEDIDGLTEALQYTSISVWTALSQQGLCVVTQTKSLG